VTRKYGKRFQEFRGAKIDVQRAKDFGKKGVVVSSTVKLSGQSPVAVDWRLSAKSGKLVDIIIEGVSLISTERSEVQSMLAAQRGSVAKLTSVLKSAG
jgi:phospholipid transport system substrate-binding protein